MWLCLESGDAEVVEYVYMHLGDWKRTLRGDEESLRLREEEVDGVRIADCKLHLRTGVVRVLRACEVEVVLTKLSAGDTAAVDSLLFGAF